MGEGIQGRKFGMQCQELKENNGTERVKWGGGWKGRVEEGMWKGINK